jgi:magnesium-transporting ATPase (P-type)
MHACETMGNANYICSDKTGTLTQNLMNMFFIFDGKKSISVKHLLGGQPNSSHSTNVIANKGYFNELMISILLNIDIEIDENNVVKNASKTDIPFINLFKIWGVDISSLRLQYYPHDQAELRKFPFNSFRKRVTTFIRSKDFPKGCRVFMKGAAEQILECCDYYIDPDTGKQESLTSEAKVQYSEQVKIYGLDALRNICASFKDIDDIQYESWKLQDESGNYEIEKSGFVFVCIAAIKDTLRPNVAEAVITCNSAGINVVMVTGDNLETAFAIAKECNIVQEADKIEDCTLDGKRLKVRAIARPARSSPKSE